MTTLSFTQVEIDGFRGLRGLNLEGLGRVNILVGQNNCGKTSVLEALSILCQPQNPDEWLSMVRHRDFGGLDETRVQSLRWCFTQNSTTNYHDFIEASCSFKCEGNFPLRQLKVQYKEFKEIVEKVSEEPFFDENGEIYHVEETIEEVITRSSEIKHLPVWSESALPLTVDKDITLKISENGFSNLGKRKPVYFIESKTLSPYSYQLNRMQLRSQSEQLFSDDSVSELLKEFDPNVVAIRIGSFSGDRPAIYIKHHKLGEAPLSVFGDAMRRAVLLTSTLLSLKDGGILLIDEVEVGIHVSALANVFKWLVDAARKLNVQVFVTTHSLEALDAITFSGDDHAEEDIVVFRLKQTEEKTESKRLSGDLLHRLRFERGLDVR